MTTIESLIGLCTNAEYLNAEGVGDGLRLTIDHIQVDSLKAPGGDTTRDKPVVYFVEDPRGWVMNVTNLTILKAMFGPDVTQWTGKRLTLYNDKRVRVKRRGKPDHVGAVRIKSSPDISQRLQVSAGGNAFRKATAYVIEVEQVADPLADALTAFGLDAAQYDVWASANKRPSFTETPAPVREKASQWIHGGGHEAIRRANAATEAVDIPQVGEE